MLTVTGDGSAVRGASGSKQGGTGTTMNSSDMSLEMLSTSLTASVKIKKHALIISPKVLWCVSLTIEINNRIRFKKVVEFLRNVTRQLESMSHLQPFTIVSCCFLMTPLSVLLL